MEIIIVNLLRMQRNTHPIRKAGSVTAESDVWHTVGNNTEVGVILCSGTLGVFFKFCSVKKESPSSYTPLESIHQQTFWMKGKREWSSELPNSTFAFVLSFMTPIAGNSTFRSGRTFKSGNFSKVSLAGSNEKKQTSNIFDWSRVKILQSMNARCRLLAPGKGQIFSHLLTKETSHDKKKCSSFLPMHNDFPVYDLWERRDWQERLFVGPMSAVCSSVVCHKPSPAQRRLGRHRTERQLKPSSGQIFPGSPSWLKMFLASGEIEARIRGSIMMLPIKGTGS